MALRYSHNYCSRNKKARASWHQCLQNLVEVLKKQVVYPKYRIKLN
jgi:hypothetical protein